MALAVGTRLGSYEVLAPLGAGGMGEVYRARDTKLDREVAIKVLPDRVASDREALARFEREAKAVAALSHPNILSIFDFGTHDGTAYAVTELLEGETLRERLASGALPLRRALECAQNVALGLAAAHDKGIVHRDLKPDNVFLTRDSRVKILDFGLARQHRKHTEDESHSPTLSQHTDPGTVLGTVGYMSPEQVRGRTIDHRSDIFSFGTVLFEMVTGARAFRRESAVETMNAILNDDPLDTPSVEESVPPALERILRHCLEKSPDERFQSARDLAFDLLSLTGGSASGRVSSGHPTIRRRFALRWWAGVAVGVALAAVAVMALWISRPRPTSSPLRRFTVPVAPADSLALTHTPPMAIAPDGSRLVYVGVRGDTSALYSRRFDRLDADSIPGTEGADGPFFSPDGQWIGYFQGGKLKKLSAHDGVSFDLCDLSPGWRGAGWSPSGAIFFARGMRSGLRKVSSQGGRVEVVTTPSVARREKTHRWPELLPGGKAIVYTTGMASHDSFDEAQIEALLLPSGERRVLIEGGMYARYAASGHLVYARDDALFAVSFDPLRVEVRGAPARVLEDVITIPEAGSAQYGLSADGTLIYARGRARDRAPRLVWVDREGKTATPLTDPRRFWAVRISPQGDRVLTAIDGANSHLWLYDVPRETLTRLTFEWDSMGPIWTPDGQRVTFAWARERSNTNIYWQPVDGSGPAEGLTSGDASQIPGSWSPDGKTLAFEQFTAASGSDIWLLSLEEGLVSEPLLNEAFNESSAMVSPDGRWLAYVSDETGRDEVYLRPFRRSGGKLQISTDGGRGPIWARDSSAVYYQSENGIMAVALTVRPSLRAARPRILVKGNYVAFDVAPNGRFVMVEENRGPAVTHLEVVLNWFEELKARVPAGR